MNYRPNPLVSGQAKWQRPTMSWVKMNVDVGVFVDGGACSVVIRDDYGRFLGVYGQKMVGFANPNLLEIFGIREALSWVKAREKSHFVIKSDFLVAVQWVNSKKQGQSTLDEIIRDCRDLLSTFSYVRVEFARRTTNTAAHKLARALQYLSGLHL